MSRSKISVNLGGCLPMIVFIITIWALAFGLPTTWGTLHIDIFPPGVYLEK